MNEIYSIKKDTPHVRAIMVSDRIAKYPCEGMPQIYHKEFDLHEFIGEEIAGIRGVNSVHYFPVLFEDMDTVLSMKNDFFRMPFVRVGSFDFKKPGVRYSTGLDLPHYEDFYTFEELLDLCPTEKNRNELFNELLEIYGLDIYSGQTDRPGNIFYEFHPNGEIHMSKLFDYEWSLDEELQDYYVADFHVFRTIASYQKMIRDYPQFEEILRSYLDVDLEKLIQKMARSRRFNLEGFDMDSYKRFDEVSHKRLEKILR